MHRQKRFCQCHSLVTEAVKSFKDLIKLGERHSSFNKAVLGHNTSKNVFRFLSKRNHKTIVTFRRIPCVCASVCLCEYARQITRDCVCVYVCVWGGYSLTHSFIHSHKRHRVNNRGQSCCPVKMEIETSLPEVAHRHVKSTTLKKTSHY